MATATENFKIALNVLARVGVDGDLIGEYSKAMATLHGMDTYNQMQAQIPPPMPQNNTPPQGNNPLAGESTTQGIIPQNTP